ncbi:hypothetical protein PR003_g28104 [Phytophthora rubi]|uniref:Secreted protein n=1 Tax=Phytophthora rubi TaxID=129364 RepID=A0A6A4C1L2_9STRA|nr:hypothetical protein PR003_g28104 [Phytophthora rubi]
MVVRACAVVRVLVFMFFNMARWSRSKPKDQCSTHPATFFFMYVPCDEKPGLCILPGN